MARILGAKRVQQKLKALRLKARRRESVIVGYTANYAVYVHENVEMKWKGKKRIGKDAQGRYWDPQGRGQSKFLEQPFREKQSEIVSIIRRTAKSTKSLLTGLLMGGLFLQRESQKLVPVDTGNLKSSAFTRKE